MRILKRLLIALLVILPLSIVVLVLWLGSQNGTDVAMEVRPNAWPLYPEGAPALPGAADQENWTRSEDGTVVAHNVSEPTLEPFLPDPSKATGTAVVIAPGGGTLALAINVEGWDVARWFADQGIAAFVLKYRTRPSPPNPYVRSLWALAQLPKWYSGGKIMISAFQPAVDDGMAALRLLRARAGEFGVDPQRIGMVGFSAGAITTLALVQQAKDEARPSFGGIIYGPLDAIVAPERAPPLFVAIAADDQFAQQTDFGLIRTWKEAGAPVEFHKYTSGGHGFGLGRKDTDTVQWPGQFLDWLRLNGLLMPRASNQPEPVGK
jgi:acetyl esterase/lipase